MADVTQMLKAVEAGETGAEEHLWREVYQELRRMAGEKMAGESREITLQATAIVHEAWRRLAHPDGSPAVWEGRAHFFTAAGEAMRRILVDQARRRLTAKRGGRHEHLRFEEAIDIAAPEDTKIIEVHEALDALESRDPQQAQIVKLLFFVGLTQKEAASLLSISEKSVQRHWILAKTFLFQEIKAARRANSPNPAEFSES